MSFLSPYIKVDCPDGPRYILRNPEKAFSIAAPDWDVRIKAVINALKDIEVGLDASAKKRVQKIVKDLDKNYAGLQAHYQAAYLQFCTNPCGKKSNKILEEANKEIRKKEFKLREIETKLETFSIYPAATILSPKEKTRSIHPILDISRSISAIKVQTHLLKDIKKLVSEFRHSIG